MKFLHISKYYFPYIGGTEQVARDCVLALKGHEQKVLCFNHEKGNKIETVDDIEIIRAGCFVKIASQSLSFSYNKLLKNAIAGFQPDVIIFHYPNPFVAHLLLKILKKHPDIKLVVYWHLDIYKQKFLSKFFHKQNKRLCKRANAVWGATPIHLKESAYYQCFKDKCTVLPYGIDTDKLIVNNEVNEYIQEIKRENKGKTICFAMGRLVPYKGMQYLIKAAKYLDDSYAIYISGDGPLKAELRNLAKNNSNIHMLGCITEKEALAYRVACDIFCFPSVTRNEGFGLALAEAMFMGKPAVTFTIPHSGVNYVSIDGQTGIEVENCNVEKYAEAIATLSKNADLREGYGQAAKQRVLENFTFDQFEENIKNVLEKVR